MLWRIKIHTWMLWFSFFAMVISIYMEKGFSEALGFGGLLIGFAGLFRFVLNFLQE